MSKEIFQSWSYSLVLAFISSIFMPFTNTRKIQKVTTYLQSLKLQLVQCLVSHCLTLDSCPPLHGMLTGNTRVLCCFNKWLGVSLSLHLMCWFLFCLFLIPFSVLHNYLVAQLWFFSIVSTAAFLLPCVIIASPHGSESGVAMELSQLWSKLWVIHGILLHTRWTEEKTCISIIKVTLFDFLKLFLHFTNMNILLSLHNIRLEHSISGLFVLAGRCFSKNNLFTNVLNSVL